MKALRIDSGRLRKGASAAVEYRNPTAIFAMPAYRPPTTGVVAIVLTVSRLGIVPVFLGELQVLVRTFKVPRTEAYYIRQIGDLVNTLLYAGRSAALFTGLFVC